MREREEFNFLCSLSNVVDEPKGVISTVKYVTILVSSYDKLCMNLRVRTLVVYDSKHLHMQLYLGRNGLIWDMHQTASSAVVLKLETVFFVSFKCCWNLTTPNSKCIIYMIRAQYTRYK